VSGLSCERGPGVTSGIGHIGGDPELRARVDRARLAISVGFNGSSPESLRDWKCYELGAVQGMVLLDEMG
jgi:hypothetical protein